jgi:hypothetical protein
MTLSILGWLVVALLVGGATSTLLLWVFGWPSLPRSATFTAADTIELLKIVLAVIAGFGGVVLLSVNHRKQKVAEGDHRLALRQEEREESKLLNERFAAAAEQLAHDSEQVRLAGVYALAGLADDWDEGRQKCVEVLIAYLRISGSRGGEVVDTLFRLFRERLTSGSPWCDVDYDFTGMKLIDMDFSGFTFLGTVTLGDVVFRGERTSFAGTSFLGTLRCHETVFEAGVTDFGDARFAGKAEFHDAVFRSALNLSDVLISGGRIEFEHCVFNKPITAREIVVDSGTLRFENCVFENAPADFQYSQFGSLWDERSWLDQLLGRGHGPTLGALRLVECVMRQSPVSLADIYTEHGRVVVRDLVLEESELRITSAEETHPWLEVRRIDARNARVDVPVPERFWKERAPEGTPQPSERDGHGGVGHDGADVREEL